MQKSCELAGRIKPFGSEVLSALFLEDLSIELICPENLEGLALRIVVRARQSHDG